MFFPFRAFFPPHLHQFSSFSSCGSECNLERGAGYKLSERSPEEETVSPVHYYDWGCAAVCVDIVIAMTGTRVCSLSECVCVCGCTHCTCSLCVFSLWFSCVRVEDDGSRFWMAPSWLKPASAQDQGFAEAAAAPSRADCAPACNPQLPPSHPWQPSPPSSSSHALPPHLNSLLNLFHFSHRL